MLSTLAQIEDASVAIGDPATLTCNAERRGTDFEYWLFHQLEG